MHAFGSRNTLRIWACVSASGVFMENISSVRRRESFGLKDGYGLFVVDIYSCDRP